MKYSLIIPTVAQTNLVKKCVESIKKHETADDYEIIIVDDGSDAKVQKWLNSYAAGSGCKIHLKNKNGGFAETVNIGLNKAEGDYLILVNNDVEWVKPILGHIEKTFLTKSDVGVIGAKLLYPTQNQTVQHAGVVRIPQRNMSFGGFIHVNKHVPRNHPSVNQSKYFISVTGALYAIRRKAWQDIGPWNENYFLSCEDTEYSLRSWLANWSVYYNHNVEALHHEGYTRGANDVEKKRINLSWFLKERETIPKFAEDLQRLQVDSIDLKVRSLNSQGVGSSVAKRRVKDLTARKRVTTQKSKYVSPIKKLEVGCGEFGQPGYIHLDIRKLRGVDVVCDFGNEPLPFDSGTLDEVLSNHSIEHVSWRKIEFVVKEWFRVLRPGGKVFFRTPDLEYICRTYLEGKTTPEHPNDENYVKAHYSEKVTPAWWANIKLFAGQDYDGNYHYFAFDFEMAKATLERFGFENVKRANHPQVFSPGELQIEAYKPLSAQITVDPVEVEVVEEDPEDVQRILVKRRGAVGDVVLATPIIRRLRELYGSQAVIDVATDCGSVFLQNPMVNQILPGNASKDGYTKVVDLDNAYEMTPHRHIIESYTETAFGESVEFDKQCSLYPDQKAREIVEAKLSEFKIFNEESLAKLVVMHCAVTWKTRTWPKDRWEKVAKGLVAKGYKIALIGKASDFVVSGEGIYNFVNQLTLQQVAVLCELASCFVSNDSGMLHIAGTTDTKIVGLFTAAKGEYRVPWRNGAYGWNAEIVKPKAKCYGCLHNKRPPVFFTDCDIGTYQCLAEITPHQVLEAVGDH